MRPSSTTCLLSGVQAGTDAFKLAGAISGRVREGQQVGLLVKGAVPVLIAVKAIGVAQEYVADDRIQLQFVVQLVDRENPELRGGATSTYTHIAVLASAQA